MKSVIGNIAVFCMIILSAALLDYGIQTDPKTTLLITPIVFVILMIVIIRIIHHGEE